LLLFNLEPTDQECAAKLTHDTDQACTLAWGLILVALLCQLMRENSVAKFFVRCVAVILHGQLVPRIRPAWEKPFVRIVCWVLLPGLFLVFYFTRFPAERAVYVFYAVAIPFLVLETINDI
jgi:hypothetical protein